MAHSTASQRITRTVLLIGSFLMAMFIFGQGQDSIRAVNGVLTINIVPSKSYYKVFVDQAITSTVFSGQVPGTTVSVLFLQDSTGHSVAFGGNISAGCTVSQTASATTGCQFLFDSANNQWTAVGGGGGTPGGSNTQIQYNNNGAFGGSSALVENPTGTVLTVSPANNQTGVSIQSFASSQTSPQFQVLSSAGANLFNVQQSATAYTVQIGGAFGFEHLNQGQASPDFAGKLACAASTVTKTFAGSFTSTPIVLVFDETTKGGANLTAISTTAFTVSCTGATDALDYIVIGNPN